MSAEKAAADCRQCFEFDQPCPDHKLLNARDAANTAGVAIRTFYDWQVRHAGTVNGVRYWFERDVLTAEKQHRRADPTQKRQRRYA